MIHVLVGRREGQRTTDEILSRGEPASFFETAVRGGSGFVLSGEECLRASRFLTTLGDQRARIMEWSNLESRLQDFKLRAWTEFEPKLVAAGNFLDSIDRAFRSQLPVPDYAGLEGRLSRLAELMAELEARAPGKGAMARNDLLHGLDF